MQIHFNSMLSIKRAEPKKTAMAMTRSSVASVGA